MRARLGAVLATAAAILAAAEASACSMAPGYKVPTGLELTTQADTIVLARITGERPSREQRPGTVIATPTVLIAFSRDAEDVSDPDAPWVRAVREYVAIGGGPRREVKARLKARAASLRAMGNADASAIADDMDQERRGRRQPLYD